MKHNKQSLLLSTLLAILVLVVISCANAGGVFKRSYDSDKDKDNARNQSTSQSRQDDQSARQADDNAKSDDQGDRQKSDKKNEDKRKKHDERQNNQDNRPTTGSHPDPTRYPPAAVGDPRPYDQRSPEPARQKGIVVPTAPVTSRSEQGKWLDRRHDWDNKYRRTNERPKAYYEHPAAKATPRYSNGYYYYGQGTRNHDEYPHSYGHWIFSATFGNSKPSVYFHYGYLPYIPATQVIILSRPRVRYIEVPIVIEIGTGGGNYYLDRREYSGVGEALGDIKSAWLDQYPERLLDHVRADSKIDVLLDGNYSYTVGAADYQAMTRDAINTTETVSFQFDSVRRRDDGRIAAYGRHEYYSTEGDRKTVYVSYLLEQIGRRWDIVEVGSGLSRLDR